VVFTWLVNMTGISALLVWGSVGIISLRFRMAFRAQGRYLSDLPYRQPFFPLLPIGTIVLAILMFVAEGYSAVKEVPFEAKVCEYCEYSLSSLITHIERGCDIYRCYPLYYLIFRIYTLAPLLSEDTTSFCAAVGSGLRNRRCVGT